MPTIDGTSVNGLLSTPLVLPVPVAGALAALFVVLVVVALRRSGAGGAQRLVLPIAAIVIAGAAAVAILERLAINAVAAQGEALLGRGAALTQAALAPGSPLACIDDEAGETVGTACEKALFADAQNTAAALAFVGARIALLEEAFAFARRTDKNFFNAFARARRAIELDRYGLAAQVLATREGCTAERCAAYAMLEDTGPLSANLRANTFSAYVKRYAVAWPKGAEPLPSPPPQASIVAPAAPTAADAAAAADIPTGKPVSSKWDFPSAASIPPISIMNPEPPLPKGAAEAQASTHSEGARTPPKHPHRTVPPPPPLTLANPQVPVLPQPRAEPPPAR